MNISDQLNVIHITLEECLQDSPFRGLDFSKYPALAKFAVQLVLLWQFGGTVLDNSMVVAHLEIYRASGAEVEYGDKMIISPFACHASVYNTMLTAKKMYSMYTKTYAMNSERSNEEIYRLIETNTIEQTRQAGRSNVGGRSVADGIECRRETNNRCHYLLVDLVTSDNNYYVRDYICPIISKASFPDINITTIAASQIDYQTDDQTKTDD